MTRVSLAVVLLVRFIHMNYESCDSMEGEHEKQKASHLDTSGPGNVFGLYREWSDRRD